MLLSQFHEAHTPPPKFACCVNIGHCAEDAKLAQKLQREEYETSKREAELMKSIQPMAMPHELEVNNSYPPMAQSVASRLAAGPAK